MAEIKFCGLTRPEDAREAASLGASYLGVIFAGGPRHLEPERARAVLGKVDATGPRRVGVFATATPWEIADVAHAAEVDIVQLHGGASPEEVEAVRRAAGCAVWAVIRVGADGLPPEAPELFAAADAVVVDAMVQGRLGGTGVALPWERLAPSIAQAKGKGRLVVAGGLTPENVGQAVVALRPNVVDVSSGVESAPGIKDHQRMRAFRDAVRDSEGVRTT